MKPRVYVTRIIPEDILDLLRSECEVKIWPEENIPVPREVLKKEITDVKGVFCLLTENFDADLISSAKELKIISNMAVGYNNIDVSAATNRGIMVTNTPGVLTETTADLTFALLMMTARRMGEAEQYLRRGEWRTWSPLLLAGQDIHNSTLGIIGLGRIGESLVKRAKGFDMNVMYYSRTRREEKERDLGIQYRELNELLKESDFVCVMTPYSEETKNLIDLPELKLMKRKAILINTARGGIVNEMALYEALKNGLILAAGLDVFEHEPVSINNPLLSLPNVVVLPHIGSASVNTRRRMALTAVNNLIQGLSGKLPDNLVNKEALK
ncbi:MAG: D-glycerate dehydrogenase [Desulfitobacterium hafniense]|nr:D-glycerate dehydrogenase [Desulfitobacterium hafniense]